MAAASLPQVAGRKADRTAAARIAKAGDVIELAAQPGTFVVVDRASGSGRAHIVTPDGSCTCKDFEYRGRVRACKHIRAVRANLGIVTCPTCRAYTTPQQHYVAGAYVWFAICRQDRTHPAQPVAD